MHVRSVGSLRLSSAPAVRAPRQRRIVDLLLPIVTIGLLAAGQAVAQEAAAPSSAQAPAPARGQASLPVKPGKNGKVCQHEDVTGSRMKKRICYTPEQWEARERAAKDLARELDGKPTGKPPTRDGNGGG